MLNNSTRKIAIKQLEKEIELNEEANKAVQLTAERLFEKREELKKTIDYSWACINYFKNTPDYMQVEVQKIAIETERYTDLIAEVQQAIKAADIKSNASIGAGVATGVGVAALAPSAIMGFATTFGVASTGTAISGLSGIAATNAALAWIGGGSLAAGGAGIVGGNALLGLAGPIGWGIAAVGVTAGGIMKNGKNKKIAADCNEQTVLVKAQTEVVNGSKIEIEQLHNLSHRTIADLPKITNQCETYNQDYSQLAESEKYVLGTLVNATLAAVQLLNKKVGIPTVETE